MRSYQLEKTQKRLIQKKKVIAGGLTEYVRGNDKSGPVYREENTDGNIMIVSKEVLLEMLANAREFGLSALY